MTLSHKAFGILAFLLSANSLAEDVESSSFSATNDVISVESTRGKRFVEPGSQTSIGKEFLDDYKQTDLNRALSTLPGIQIQEEDGYGLRVNIGMRGAHPHRSRKVLMMEDGILIGPAPYSAPAAYYTPLMTRLDGLVVTKGSSAIAYGPQTIGGAIDFQTLSLYGDDIESPFVSAELAAGSYGFQKASAAIKSSHGNVSYLLHAADVRSTGFKTISGEKADTGFHKNDILAKASLILGNDELFFKIGQTDERSNETYLGLTEEDFSLDPYDRYAASALDLMDNRHRQLQIGYALNRSSFSVRTTAYYHTFERLWYKFNGLSGIGLDAKSIIAEPYGRNQHAYAVIKGVDDSLGANDQIVVGSNDRSYQSFGLDVKAEHQIPNGFLGDHTIEWGLRLHGDSIKREHGEDNYLMSLGTLVRSQDQSRQMTAQNEDSAKALSVFLLDTLKIAKLRLNFGLRLEKVELTRKDDLDFAGDLSANHDELIPGLGLFYLFDESFGAFFGVNKGLALASIDDAGSGKPEQSINYELGVRFEKNRLASDLVGFYSDYTNIKGTCSFSSGCSSQDIDKSFDGGKAKVYGIEFMTRYTGMWAQLYWPVSFQYTYTHGVFDNSFQSSLADWGIGSIRVNDPLPYIPHHQASLNLGIKGSLAQFMASYRYVSQSFDQAVEEGRKAIEQHRVLDVSVSIWPYTGSPYELYMTADNVLKSHYLASYRPFGARPGKPQSVSVGIKASL